MILKGSQRAGAGQMGFHLLRTDDNDHVEVHEIRGFISGNVVDALREAFAISRGTKCTQFLYSLSLSPPERENIPVGSFEKAIEDIEQRLGLAGQPRVVVFHEKEGRRHAHCVWSRIKADTMTAINIAYPKLKLKEMSRQLYVDHGWKMPRGLVNSEERNPLNFTREEWQQANRVGRDPKAIKQIFQDCWAISDSLKAFQQALEARGYYLAQGDRRGHVAVDWKGEVYSLSRWTDAKPKQLRQRLGAPDGLPHVEMVKAEIQERIRTKLDGFAAEARRGFEKAHDSLLEKKRLLVARQRAERGELRDLQSARAILESRRRAARFRTGLKGLWDWVTGKMAELRRQNEREHAAARKRDRGESQQLIERQLAERRKLQQQITVQRSRFEEEATLLRSDVPPAVREEAPGLTRIRSPRRRHGQSRALHP